jgi:hypothetical protein
MLFTHMYYHCYFLLYSVICNRIKLWIYIEMVFIYSFYCCAQWGYFVAFTNVLTMYQKHHTWIHPSSFFVISPPPTSGIVSTVNIFPFACLCARYLHYIYLHMPFSHLLYLPTSTNPQAGPVLLSCLWCCKWRKKWHFLCPFVYIEIKFSQFQT